MRQLQRRLAEAEAALAHEQSRADRLSAQLQHLRLSSPAAARGSDAAGGASAPGDEMVQVRRSTLELLALKERAMDAAKEGITIADATTPDMPLIYVNEGFARLTGYPTAFARGKNCRFLQGPGTDPATVTELREAMTAGRHCVVQLMVSRGCLGKVYTRSTAIVPPPCAVLPVLWLPALAPPLPAVFRTL